MGMFKIQEMLEKLAKGGSGEPINLNLTEIKSAPSGSNVSKA